MKIQYFNTVFGDLKGSPHWVRKMFFLALVMFIPVFGGVVVQSYLYGWARDAAAGVQAPLPKRVFGNEDGQLYARAGRLFVVQLAYQAIPIVLILIATIFVYPWPLMFDLLRDTSLGRESDALAMDFLGRIALYTVFCCLIGLLGFVLGFFNWAGSLRTSIFGNIKAGLQLGEIIAMFKRDFMGILKIFGMSLLVSLVLSMAVSLVSTVVTLPLSMVAGVILAGIEPTVWTAPDAIVAMIVAIGGVSLLFTVIGSYFGFVAGMFTSTLLTRALGYWARSSIPELGWQPGMVAPGIWPATPGPGAPGTVPNQGYPAPPPPQSTQPNQPNQPPPPQL